MWRRALLVFALVLGTTASGRAETAAQPTSTATAMPTVVELFTSQGCNSCPPADVFLTELARRPGVIALTYDVDYWNYLGWKDTFATAATTARQKAYAERISNGELYTPEMVIGGTVAVTGSDRAAVEQAIVRVARSQAASGIVLRAARDASGAVRIALPPAKQAATPGGKAAVVWLVGYDSRRVVKIMQGENRGRTITYTNVVRYIRPIGRWPGQAETITLDSAALKGADHALIMVQAADAGAIVGCVKLPTTKPN